MSVQKVVCTHCGSALKSDKPVPLGTQIKCPRCQKVFAVAAVPAVAATAGIRPASASGQPRPATKQNIRTGPAPQRPMSSPTFASAPPAGGNKTARLVIILFVLLLLVGGIGTTVFLLIRGESGDKPGPGPVAVVPTKDNPAPANTVNNPPVNNPPLNVPTPPKKVVKQLVELKPDEEKKIKGMVAEGVSFLKGAQTTPGFWGKLSPNKFQDQVTLGETALVMLTLLECGVDRNDPVIQKAKKALWPHFANMTMTYSVAVAVLLLEKLDDPADKDLLEMLALRLIAAQRTNGSWNYDVPYHFTDTELRELRDLLKSIKNLPRDEYSNALGDQWNKASGKIKALACIEDLPKQPAEFSTAEGDNSNTQFALLALWKARGKGVPSDRSLRLAVQRFRMTQERDGTWFYAFLKRQEFPPHPTMTCAGLVGLAIGHALDEKGPAAVQADGKIHAGLAVIEKTIRPDSPQLIYYLWSVERVAVLFQLPKINEKDWFRWGLGMLEANQGAGGEFSMGGHDKAVDTSFALLFLNRINLAADLTDKIRDDTPWALPAATLKGN